MEFIVIIFSVGIAFLLLGIIGKVEAFQIKAGTDNKKARIAFVILGILFILWANVEYSAKVTIEQTNEILRQYNKNNR